MALIKCPECGKEVSDQAESCPNCGYPIFGKVNKYKENNGDENKEKEDQQNVSDRTDGISLQQEEEQRTDNKENTKQNYTQRSMVLILVGLFFALLSKIISVVLVILGIYYIVRTKKNGFKIPIGNIVLLCIMLVFSIISWNIPHGKKASDNTQNKSQIVSTIKSTERVKETLPPTVAPTPVTKEKEEHSAIKKDKVSKKKKISKKQYQAQCKMQYHDAVFFTKKNLKGKHVKLRLFIGEKKFFDRYVDSETSSFIRQNRIQRTYYECYVKRKGSTSYVSKGSVTVYLPKNFKPDKFRTGSYITIYGKVALFSNSTWTGYNSVSVVAKYIEKGKR